MATAAVSKAQPESIAFASQMETTGSPSQPLPSNQCVSASPPRLKITRPQSAPTGIVARSLADRIIGLPSTSSSSSSSRLPPMSLLSNSSVFSIPEDSTRVAINSLMNLALRKRGSEPEENTLKTLQSIRDAARHLELPTDQIDQQLGPIQQRVADNNTSTKFGCPTRFELSNCCRQFDRGIPNARNMLQQIIQLASQNPIIPDHFKGVASWSYGDESARFSGPTFCLNFLNNQTKEAFKQRYKDSFSIQDPGASLWVSNKFGNDRNKLYSALQQICGPEFISLKDGDAPKFEDEPIRVDYPIVYSTMLGKAIMLSDLTKLDLPQLTALYHLFNHAIADAREMAREEYTSKIKDLEYHIKAEHASKIAMLEDDGDLESINLSFERELLVQKQAVESEFNEVMRRLPSPVPLEIFWKV